MKKNSRRFAEPFGFRASVAAVVSCLAFSAMPTQVDAAGLGKVVVFSALGQPLRAEIEVHATAAELSGMRVQMASQEAFKQAGLDYTTSLRGITFTLDRRSAGRPVIRLSSNAPISEPLVDMLVELNWSTGRLVREYTFLLDPPEVAASRNARTASVPIAAPSAQQAAVPAGVRGGASSSAITEDTRARAIASIQGQPLAQNQTARQAAAPKVSVKTRAPTSSASAGTSGGDTYVVKQGDTLHKIASETRPDGVTLEQMLIGLLRANQQAFGGGNMNRLRAGKILTVPDKSAVESIAPKEARKIVATQTAEWHAYRNKLASIAAQSPAADSAAQQGAAGRITARVEDKIPAPSESGDQVKVSKSGSGVGRSGRGRASGNEDAIARDKALQEANERVAMLEQNVSKLQQLLEMKDRTLAELQQQAVAAKGASTSSSSAPTPAEPPKAAVDSSSTSQPPTTTSSEPPKPAEPSTVVAQAPTTSQPETPVQTAPPVVDAKPPEPAKPAARPVPPPPPPPEPSFLETLFGNPMTLAGGGGVLALLGAFLFMRRRRANENESSLEPLSLSTPSVGGSNLTANSVFRSTGGQSVDTSHASQTDFSQAGPGSIDTDEVDPVAEADVYIAYGRDAQAEEILLEAKRKDPKRHAINLKLLEIYASRKDMKQFGALATELRQATGGHGVDWEKAVAIGQRFDPENPLFGGKPVAPETAAPAVVVAPKIVHEPVTPPSQAATFAMGGGAASVKPNVPPPAPEPEAPLDMSSLDFDLGAGKVESAKQDVLSASAKPTESQTLDFDLAVPPSVADASKEAQQLTASVLDFSLPESSAEKAPEAAPSAKPLHDLDFDLGGFDAKASVPPPAQTAKPPVAPLANDLEFDVDLTASTFLGNQMLPPEGDFSPRSDSPAAPGLSQIDMQSIDLDLEATQPSPVKAPAGGARKLTTDADQASTVVNTEFIDSQLGQSGLNELAGVGANEEVATKLDLARAYEEMGDLAGARELLREVVNEGNAEQREKAKGILAKIGS